jgi:2-oxo-3-hexenedioate decarboxylase
MSTADPKTDSLRAIAAEAVAAFAHPGSQVQPFSTRYPILTMDNAYGVTAVTNEMRVAKGETPLGRKVGFTNRQMWTEYGVHAPNWGYIYDSTIHDLSSSASERVAEFAEPKIEPEIMVGLAQAPSPGMDDAALLACIAWVAHGFEIVQSIFPNWKFSGADSVAANAMHGALLMGPRHTIEPQRAEWLRALPAFAVELYCNGTLMERGTGANVLEGPLSVLRHLADLLARDRDNPPLAGGEIISTGTLTRALPVKAGETWTTKLAGIALEGVSLRFA